MQLLEAPLSETKSPLHIQGIKPYTGNRDPQATSANPMKKLKVQYQDRVNRALKMPVEIHSAVKELAQKQRVSIAEFYDQIIYNFVKEVKDAKKQISYVFPPHDGKRTNFYLRERTLFLIKELSTRDNSQEILVIFTAIMDFIKTNSVLTD